MPQQLELFSDADFMEQPCKVEENKQVRPERETASCQPAPSRPKPIHYKNQVENFDESVRRRSRKKRLRVTFPDGEVVCSSSATDTFVEALKKIGVGKLKYIEMEVNHVRLISNKMDIRYGDMQKALGDGWYVMTQSDTEQKYRQLLSIKQQLGLDIKVEMSDSIEPVGKSDSQHGGGHKSMQLRVMFPDGKYVAYSNPIDTYVSAILYIGIDKLLPKRLEFSGKQLITYAKQYNGQSALSNGLWLTVPPLSKDKMKWLKVIGAIMHKDMLVTLK